MTVIVPLVAVPCCPFNYVVDCNDFMRKVAIDFIILINRLFWKGHRKIRQLHFRVNAFIESQLVYLPPHGSHLITISFQKGTQKGSSSASKQHARSCF